MAAPGIVVPSPDRTLTPESRTIILSCGIAATLLYTAMLVVIPLWWDGYSSAAHTVSELSAIDAPTRSLWVPLGMVYTVLFAVFGWGVWMAAGGNRPLRVVGTLIIVHGLIGLGWPPMHLRGTEFTLTDTLHIVWASITVVLCLLEVGFGAAAFGKRFRIYSVTSLALLIVTGALTGVDAPRIAANLPTPWVGLWERVNIAVYLLWIVVLAVTLIRAPAAAPQRRLP